MRPINPSRRSILLASSQSIRLGTLVVPIMFAGCTPNSTSHADQSRSDSRVAISSLAQTPEEPKIEIRSPSLHVEPASAVEPSILEPTTSLTLITPEPTDVPVPKDTAILDDPVSNIEIPESTSSESDVSATEGSQDAIVENVVAGSVGDDTTTEKVRIRFSNREPLPETVQVPTSFELVSSSSSNESTVNQIAADDASTSVSDNEATDSTKRTADESEPQDGVVAVNDRKTTVQLNEAAKKPVPPSKTPSSIVVASEAEKNQIIAADWPAPWAALYITGQQYGYLEPCGCTGLENQKGGINRRDTLLKQVMERGWEVFPIDAGNQVRRTGRQSEIKYQKTIEAFRAMNYRAVGLGPHDLNLSFTELLLPLFNDRGDIDSPFVSANVVIHDSSYMDRFKVIRVGNRKIAVTSVLGDDMRKAGGALASDLQSIEIGGAIESLQATKKLIDAEKCDYVILIAHTSLEESAKLAQSVAGIDLVITAGGYGEPTYKPEPIDGTDSVMVQVGTKGMYAGLFALYDDSRTPFRYQRIALSSQFEDSPRMTELFKRYQSLLKETGFQRLGLRPQTHASNNEFVGSQKCGECHSTAFSIWENTPHAHATDSIISPPARSDIERHFDPECLSCHVTGWNPQQFYNYRTGYVSLEDTPLMTQNGCENCHGPGSAHVAAEEGEGNDATFLARLRESMRLPLAQAKDKCLECHDIDNSPDFHNDGAFEEYWEKVKHYGKD